MCGVRGVYEGEYRTGVALLSAGRHPREPILDTSTNTFTRPIATRVLSDFCAFILAWFTLPRTMETSLNLNLSSSNLYLNPSFSLGNGEHDAKRNGHL